MEKLMPKID